MDVAGVKDAWMRYESKASEIGTDDRTTEKKQTSVVGIDTGCNTTLYVPQNAVVSITITGVVLYCGTITTGVVWLSSYHRCCTVLLNYYHRCRIVMLNYYHWCRIAELLPQVLYCWTVTTGVVVFNYYHMCCIAELLPQVMYS